MIPGQRWFRTASPGERATMLLGLAIAVPEGYDTVAYGAALPALLSYEPWSITVAQAGVIGSLAPIGMALGTFISGIATDRFGRRRVILAGTALFTIASLLCALAPNPTVLSFSRLLVGCGAGAVMTIAVALVFEYSPERRRNFNASVLFAGVGLGGSLAALVAALAVPTFGFRFEFLVGGLIGLLVLPAAARYLPESVLFLQATGRTTEAQKWAKRLGISLVGNGGTHKNRLEPSRAIDRLATLLSRRYAATTLLLTVALFSLALLVIGVSTWLPQLMREAGYPDASAQIFLLALTLGTGIGPLIVGKIGDVIGSTRALTGGFLLILVGVVGISFTFMPTIALYAFAFVAGAGAIGTRSLLSVFVASSYPTEMRATALGATLTAGQFGGFVGPVLGGTVLAAELHPNTNFYVFASPAIVGVLCVLLVTRTVRRSKTAAKQRYSTSKDVSRDSALV